MNLTGKEANNAHIVICFKFKGPKLKLIIKNIGKPTAKNVQIKSNPKIENSKGDTYDSLMKDIPSFPHWFWELVTYFDMTHAYFNKFKEWKKYDLTVTFDNIYDEKITESYTLDLNFLKNLHTLGSESDSCETSLYGIKRD